MPKTYCDAFVVRVWLPPQTRTAITIIRMQLRASRDLVPTWGPTLIYEVSFRTKPHPLARHHRRMAFEPIITDTETQVALSSSGRDGNKACV